MKIKRLSLALGLGLVSSGLGVALFNTPTYAVGCEIADGLATDGVVTSSSELEYAIANGLASVALGDDFTVSCELSYISDNFTLDLNNHVLTSEVAWALDVETSGVTVTIKDSGSNGKYTFNDAGIWAQNGANVTIESGTIEGTAGRGRGIQIWDGKFTMTGGNVLVANGSDWSSVLVFGEGASAEISGGKITSTDGRALYVSDEGNSVTFSGGEISSTGNYALMISDLATLTMSGGKVEANDFPLTVFNGSTANITGGEVHSKTGFAVSANFMESPAYMNISGGTLTSDGDFAILFPGDPESVSKLSITGDPVITGAGGVIAMNSGILEITGGTLTSLGTEEHTGTLGNGSNGFTTSLLGLAAAYADVNATITGGTFINQGNSELVWTTDTCKGLGTSGTCDMSLSITGGRFNEIPTASYVADGYDVYDTGETPTYLVSTIMPAVAIDPVYLQPGETYTYDLGESGTYAHLESDDTSIATIDGMTATAGSTTGSTVIKAYYGGLLDRQSYSSYGFYTYEIGTEENDDAGSDEIRNAVKAFAAEEIKSALSSDDIIFNDGKAVIDVASLKEAIAAGKQISVSVDIEEVDLDVFGIDDLEAGSEIGALISENQVVAAAYWVGLNISTEDGAYVGLIYGLDTPVSMSLGIPENYRVAPSGYTRMFHLIRGHMNAEDVESATELDFTLAEDSAAVAFENDLFSAFVITYEDEQDAEAPDTGAFTNVKDSVVKNSKYGVILLATGIMMVGFGFVSLGNQYLMRERNTKD